MKEVIAIIRPERWRATVDAAMTAGVGESLQFRVMGRGKQQGLRYLRPQGDEGAGVMPFLPKRMVSWLVADERVPALKAAIVGANKTDSFGDGKLFVCPADDLVEMDEAPVASTAGVV